jgi:hypothetical protein
MERASGLRLQSYRCRSTRLTWSDARRSHSTSAVEEIEPSRPRDDTFLVADSSPARRARPRTIVDHVRKHVGCGNTLNTKGDLCLKYPGRAAALREALRDNKGLPWTPAERAMLAEWLKRLADSSS